MKLTTADAAWLPTLEKPELRRLRRQRLMTSRQQRKFLKAHRRRHKGTAK